MRTLILAALVAAVPAVAAPVYRDSAMTVRLTDKPCEHPVLASLLERYGEPRLAQVIFQGRQVATCWTLVGNQVLLADEDGDAGTLAVTDFKNEPGI